MELIEIGAIRKQLDEIRGKSVSEQIQNFRKLLSEHGLGSLLPWNSRKDTVIESCLIRIHTVLQTEMMRIICESAEKSCKSAAESSNLSKWSCRWAAIAAVASGIGAIASLACAIIAVTSI
jgi:hypothetical protein